MSQNVTIGQKSQIPVGESIVVSVQKKDIAVFHVAQDEFYAIDDCCPHAGASLAGGHVEGGIVTCPWHAWRFRLNDGAWADNPKVKTACYPVHLQGDDIVIELPTSETPS